MRVELLYYLTGILSFREGNSSVFVSNRYDCALKVTYCGVLLCPLVLGVFGVVSVLLYFAFDGLPKSDLRFAEPLTPCL